MNSDIKLANTFGAKSARACDNCIKRRAGWYCAADDAFLCKSCDSSVHSANDLARRHERVRLKISSIKSLDVKCRIYEPFWHKGFTKKARTPRQKRHEKSISPSHLVPEICSEVNSSQENEEQLQCRVPTFDRSASKPCNSVESVDINIHAEMYDLDGFLPSEMDLAEFAADVESLLGKGLDDNSLFSMEGLGLLDCDEEQIYQVNGCGSLGRERVKLEAGRDDFEFNFGYDSAITGGEEEKNFSVVGQPILVNMKCDSKKKQNFLRLDYEGIISNWDGGKSPWTTGERPELDSGDCWPDCSGKCGEMHVCGETNMMSGAAMGDGGREARVSRYREKRRNRLFSKKIRYEVRKLNAEKRPRMKGRFVKRASFVTAAPSLPLLSARV
ncbi:zinc finger protein CONSTANS-LIKE 16 [Dorcoceras hygrometricum]|uniref:Zinc finger protein CONSTANS-LIKE 16 n=1 Tax=Dorcoceras hygrometricum TaxID=472368 RepID=A0A2Z7A6G1_9LAMI|nr:zinc finger protein CONSTANS-LIKE 16 [Dorcoceras hygrometricum]